MCKYRFGKLDSDLGPDDIIGPKSVLCFRDRKCVELVSETCVCLYMCLSINSNVLCQGYECSV